LLRIKWVKLIAAVCLFSCSFSLLAAPTPTAEQLKMLGALTPEQLQQIKQMSSKQRETLAQKTKSGVAKNEVAAPVAMKARGTGLGKLEGEVQPAADAVVSDAEVVNSAPVEQDSMLPSDETGVHQAFEAFVRKSKPMTVSTKNLQQFGYELFANQPTSFAPVTDVPVPPEYVLGPGDEINVQMFGKDSQSLSLTVDREGAVAFPQIGPISLAGLSFAQAKAMLAEQIKQKMIGVSVSITMGKLRSIRIFALGDVYRPGSYTVSGLATLSHALFACGGVKKIGSLRNIELKRSGRRIGSIDLYDFLLHGNTSKDVRLLPGDVVFVPTIGKTVTIAGKVMRPAIYELAGKNTVGDVLTLAGGLLPDAYTGKALIERFNPTGDKQVLNIDISSSGLSVPVKNGDVIKIFASTEFETNQVLLLGNIKRPGKYAWHKGMRILDLIPSRDDLLPESLMDYGIIESEAEDNREKVVTRFKLGELMSLGDPALNVLLKPRDRVYVFQRDSFREQPKLNIIGSVQKPGLYEFKRNMRLADLVLAAGGLLRDSDPEKVELYRTDPISKEITLFKEDLKLAMEGDKTDDILLQDMDRIVVHSIFERKQRDTVSVSGEVHNPETLERSKDMRVSDLVFAAGNVTEEAYLGKAEITRYKVVNGERRISEHFEIDLAAALRGDEASNIRLQSDDSLIVRRVSDWKDAGQMTILGEVQHPGTYSIKKGERLSSLLARTGGYSKGAYLDASVFTRESVREEQQKQIEALSSRLEGELGHLKLTTDQVRDPTIKQRELQNLASSKRVLSQLKSTKAVGRIVIELSDVEKFKGSSYDIQVHDGDKLYIPARPDEILVLGEVYNQSALIYDPKKTKDDYLRQAGPSGIADLSEIYVVRANGSIDKDDGGWFRSQKLYPGDTLVVPQRLTNFNLLDSVLDWSRATMQIATTAASLKFIGIF